MVRELQPRIDRLGQLALELSRLAHGWLGEDGPWLRLERRAMFACLHSALRGAEEARVVLARTRDRLEGWPYGGGKRESGEA